MSHLVSIALGPVQEFIAAARRTRDLWSGSWLLSEISKAAALNLQERGAELLFPPRGADLAKLTVTNKILAVIDSAHLDASVAGAEKAANDRLREIGRDARIAAASYVELSGEFNTQLQQFIEFYAAWTPYDPLALQRARNRVDQIAAARKSVRDFSFYQGQSGIYKSSLDGKRESVITLRKEGTFESTLGVNERLDAIGVVKRFLPIPADMGVSGRFESTTDVAGVGFGLRAEREHPEEFGRYRKLTRGPGRGIYSLLYKHSSRVPDDMTPEQFGELLKLRKVFGSPNPPYYALLVGDGDGIGDTISNLTEKPLLSTFSRRLSEFSAEARNAISKWQGCPVFTGGDDVQALLPLHTALECAMEIRNRFALKLAEFGPPTFTAGLAVAHALDPLQETLDAARKAEKGAKATPGKDALGITVIPRSGAEVSACGKWDEFVPDLLAIGAIPQSLAYSLRHLELSTPVDHGGILGKLAVALGEKKDCAEQARSRLASVVTRSDLVTLYTRMLVARPFHRAKKEAASG